MKKKFTLSKTILYLMVIMLVNACAHGYKDDYTFDPGVRNATLESPDPEGFKVLASPDGATVKITWPVVLGAGGYQASLYIVDDAENPILVGEENQFVDGCSIQRPLKEDTKYMAVVKTLGNEEYNNKGAESATEKAFTTLVIATPIPDGTDLYTYFTENPIPASNEIVAYELESGGSYTMSGNVKNNLTNVIIRGDKVHHPTVRMSSGVFLSDAGDLKFQFIDFDCATFTGSAFITFNATQDPTVISQNWVKVVNIIFQSCKVTDLPKRLMHDSAKKYAVQNMLIKDCVISLAAPTQVFMRMEGGFIKDLKIENSTIYYKQRSSAYFIQYSNAKIADVDKTWLWTKSGVTILNSTFWQAATTNQFSNYGGMNQTTHYIDVEKTIFVDCGNEAAASEGIIKRLCVSANNVNRKLGYNSYWYNGVFAINEISNAQNDNSGTHFITNPDLRDPANGDFTVQGADQINARTGDPRWLP